MLVRRTGATKGTKPASHTMYGHDLSAHSKFTGRLFRHTQQIQHAMLITAVCGSHTAATNSKSSVAHTQPGRSDTATADAKRK